MSLISVKCFTLVIITLCVYYLLPLRFRWCALLISSAVFYSFFGLFSFVTVLLISLFSFAMAIVIEKSEKGRKKRTFISIAVTLIVVAMAVAKFSDHFESLPESIIAPIGLSYFSLSIIGYLLDVYWKRQKAERNFAHYLTFVFYFPKIVQGPISRFNYLENQLISGNEFSFDEINYGVQLLLWGVFKKLVIADRLSILVASVYDNLDVYSYHGIVLLAAMFASAIQLYFDFSGYTDIAIGISQMFGVKLESNFNHPFFSRSAIGFWQRWHMTLSGWFKDYLFFPVSRSNVVKKLSKTMGNRFGPTARKKTMIIISTAVVWLATGLWHGTGINYIVWGLYWGGIVIVSELLEPAFFKFKELLRIRDNTAPWVLIQMVRTFLIFVVGKMISAQESLKDVGLIITGIINNIDFRDFSLLLYLGLENYDFWILVFGFFITFIVSVLQEKGIHIRESVSEWHILPKCVVYSAFLTVILLLGLYGKGYDTSTFAYQFF